MRLDFIREVSSPWRRIFAVFCLAAFLGAIALSAAPQLHEQLHPGQDAGHVCAITLLSSGSCEHTPCDALTTAPQRLRPECAFSQPHFPSIALRLEFSLLEHAPPIIS